ncbi:MAG: guanylate kinase [candidate division WOR-3 bacterium]
MRGNHGQFILVISGPSGSGKSTVIKKVIESTEGLWLSISATTRPQRPGETHGVDYLFMSESDFLAGIEKWEFAEWAKVFGHYYGTPKKPLVDHLEAGMDVVLEIDTQGAKQIREIFGPRCITAFVAPPSIDELVNRLLRRGTEDKEQLAQRLEAARKEMREGAGYDYWVINDDLEEAASDIAAIVRAERCKRSSRFS